MNGTLVLVVDDNPTNLKLAAEVLGFEGFEVLVAEDAEEAKAVLQTFTPKVILMDIALPGMDGLQLTKLIKADPRTRDIVVIALTAFAMKGDEARALEAGCDGYIPKPIDTRKLSSQIAELLRMGPASVDGNTDQVPSLEARSVQKMNQESE